MGDGSSVCDGSRAVEKLLVQAPRQWSVQNGKGRIIRSDPGQQEPIGKTRWLGQPSYGALPGHLALRHRALDQVKRTAEWPERGDDVSKATTET